MKRLTCVVLVSALLTACGSGIDNLSGTWIASNPCDEKRDDFCEFTLTNSSEDGIDYVFDSDTKTIFGTTEKFTRKLILNPKPDGYSKYPSLDGERFPRIDIIDKNTLAYNVHRYFTRKK